MVRTPSLAPRLRRIVETLASPHVAAGFVFAALFAFPLANLSGTAAEAGSTGRVEVASARTETSQTFRNANGSYTTALHTEPVHFKDSAGRWAKIDSSLVEQKRDGYRYANRANRFRVRFKDELKGDFARVELGSVPYSLRLEGADETKAEINETSAVYRDALASTDLQYDVTAMSLKETLVLKDRRAPNHFRFTLSGRLGDHPLVEKLEDGGWQISTPDEGHSSIILRAPFATDRPDGKPLAKPHATLRARSLGNRVALDLVVDKKWLSAPGRRFPVQVDPTIEVTTDTFDASFDVACGSCTPYTGDWHLMGTRNGEKWRTAVKFDLGDIPPGANITGANVKLYFVGWCIPADGSCAGPHQLDVHKLLKPWGHATPSGELKVESTALTSFTLATNPQKQWMTWNVTKTVENWQHGLIPNHGLVVKRSDEEPANASGPLSHSTRWHEPSFHPRLEVTYTSEAVELLTPPTLHSNGADLAWTPYSSLTREPFERYEVHRSADTRFTPSRATLLTTSTDPATTTYRDTTAAPSKTFTYKLVTNGAPSNERTVTLPPNGQARKFLQSGAEGTDNHIWSGACDSHGAQEELHVGSDPWGEASRTLITFGLGDIPASSTVRNATLSLWSPWLDEGTPQINVHRLTASWAEGNAVHECDGGGATWTHRSPGVAWTTPGGDFHPTPVASVDPTEDGPNWSSFNVTSMVDQWVRAVAPNHGALIKQANETIPDKEIHYLSSDWTLSPTVRPKLEVFYDDGSDAIEPTVSITEPAPGLVKGSVNVTANASDDRRVETVQFFVDGKQISSDQAPPFTIAWDSKKASNGLHSLTAKAIDDAGNETTSSAVQVTVGNSAPPSTTVEVVPNVAYTKTVHSDTPLAYWRLGEAAGIPTAYDSTPNGRNGVYENGVVRGASGALTGDPDTSANFDGVDDRVYVADDPGLRLNGSWSIEFWAKKLTFANTYPGFIRKGSSHTANGYLIFYQPDGRLYLKRNDQYPSTAAGALTSTFRHFVVTYDGTRLRWWVDGQLSSSHVISFPPNNGTDGLEIGKGDQHGNHGLDEVAFYSTSLSAARVRAHFRAGSAGARSAYRTEVMDSAPDSYLRLGEPPGAGWARDATRNRYDGIYELYATPGVPGALANDADTAATFNAPEEDGVVVQHRDALDFDTHDFTLEAWVKTTQNGERVIVGKYDDGEQGWRFTATDDGGYTGRLRLSMTHSGVEKKFYGPPIRIDDGNWHHVVASVNRARGADLYVDGVRASTDASTLGDIGNGVEFEIGDTHEYPPWQGEIDDVAIYSRALAEPRVQVHYNKGHAGTGYDAAVLKDDPRAYWRLGEPADWVLARDDSGNAHHGRVQGPKTGLDGALGAGDSNTAANFSDDRLDYVDLGDRYDFAGTAPFSLEAWIRPTAFEGCGRIFSKEDTNASGRQGWGLCTYMDGDEPGKYGIGLWRYLNDSFNSVWTEQKFPIGSWSHVVGTYSGTELALYVDGEKAASQSGATISMPNTDMPTRVGDSAWAWWDPFDGEIDEAAIYTRALTQTEINEHNDAAVGAGNSIAGAATVRANASDDVGVTKVEFYDDGTKFAEDVIAPYEVSWDTLDAAKPAYDGVHHLTSKAYDAHDQVTESSRVRVTVANTAGTRHRADFASTTMPESVSGPVDVEVKITNASQYTWTAGQMAVAYRWLDPVNPLVVAEGTPVPIGTLASGGSLPFTLAVTPPTLPPGMSRGQYRLRIDVKDTSVTPNKWFAAAGNKPLERLTSVLKTLPYALGLERYYQYDGEELGAGMQHLLNVASGNSIVRWTPFESPGRGLSTVLDLTYNSQEGSSTSPPGNGWSLGLSSLSRVGTPLKLSPDGLTLELVDGDGTLHKFEKAAAGYWKEPPGVHLYLRELAPADPRGKWAFTRPDRVTFFFTADGYPNFVEEKNGNRMTFVYETALASEVPPGGSLKRLVAVRDAAGREFTIDYLATQDANDLDNPSFESTIEPWETAQVATRVTAPTRFGGHSLEARRAPGTGVGTVEINTSYEVEQSFSPRHFSVYLRASERSRQGFVMLSWIDPDTGEPEAEASNWETVAPGRWTRLSVSLDGIADVLPSLGISVGFNDVPEGETVYFDGLSVTESAGLPYSDPDWPIATTDSMKSRIATIADHNGSRLDFRYGTNGNLTQLIQRGDDTADDRSFSFAYDGSGRVTRVTDPRANYTDLGYGGAGRLDWRRNRAMELTSYGYDVPNRITNVTMPLSRIWSYKYDTDGKPVRITNPKSEQTTVIWSRDRHVTKVVEPTGVFVEYAYDDNGYLTDQFDELRNHSKLEYEYIPVDANDVAGKWADGRSQPHISQLIRKTDPKGMATQSPPDDYQWGFFHDDRGNMVKTTDPLGYSQETVYHENGTVSAMIDANRNKTTLAGYDGNGLPTVIVEPTGSTTRFGYDVDGLLRWVQDPNHAKYPEGPVTDPEDFRAELFYDPFQRLVRQSAPRSTEDHLGELICSSVVFDPNDNVTEEHPPHPTDYSASCAGGYAPHKRATVFDWMDRPIEIVTPPHASETRKTTVSYDDAGRLDRITAPRGVATAGNSDDFTTQYTYDLLDRVVTESGLTGVEDPAPRRAHYCYDLAGDLRWVTGPRAGLGSAPTDCANGTAPTFTTKLDYDNAHRGIRTTSPLDRSQSVTYDANGQVATTTDALGSKSTNTYNERGQLVQTSQPFTQNAEGKVTRFVTRRLEYDAVGNLTREISPRGFDSTTPDHGFRDYVTSYDYDEGDRLVRVRLPKDDSTDKAWVHNRYDQNGNVVWTSLPVDTPTPGLLVDAQKTLVEYFDPGWIKAVTEPGSPRVTFDYTPRGDQASRQPFGQPNVETWEYFPDGLLKKNVDPNNHVNTYAYDVNGNLTLTDDATGVSNSGQTPRQVQHDYNMFDEPVETRQYNKPSGGGLQLFRTDRQTFDRHGNALTRTDDVGSPSERFHNFVHDQDDLLIQDFDDGLPGCEDDQVVETDYLPTGWVSRDAIRKRPATCEQSGWPTRQVATYAYFRNGDVEKQETFKGLETDSNNLVESHALSYVTDSGVYMNGHRIKDVYKLVGPNGAGPCAANSCTATYSYDARDRLVSWANGLPAGQGQTSISYEFDRDPGPSPAQTLAGNVTREAATVNGQAQAVKEYTYSDGGQMRTFLENGTLKEKYFYERGNLRCITGATANDCSGATLESYTWDPLDRLDKFTSSGPRGTKAEIVDYVYDALDRPVKTIETRGAQQKTPTNLEYLGLSDAVSNETRGTEAKRYGFDANLNRTGVNVTGGLNPGNYTYGRNAHGDVSLLLQETGGAKAAYGYRPYGDKDTGLFAEPGDDTDPLNPYRFNDRRLDAGSGSIDMGARRFSPDTGRFLQQDFYRAALDDVELSADPLTQNRYGFAGGNPISFVEVDGHGSIDFRKLGQLQRGYHSTFNRYKDCLAEGYGAGPCMDENYKWQKTARALYGYMEATGLWQPQEPMSTRETLGFLWGVTKSIAGFLGVDDLRGCASGKASSCAWLIANVTPARAAKLIKLRKARILAQNNRRGKKAEGEIVAELRSRFGVAQGNVYARTTAGKGGRWLDAVAAGGRAYEVKTGRVSLSKFIETQIAKDMELLNNPRSGINSVTWVFRKSSKTGKIGPSPKLREALRDANIRIIYR